MECVIVVDKMDICLSIVPEKCRYSWYKHAFFKCFEVEKEKKTKIDYSIHIVQNANIGSGSEMVKQAMNRVQLALL